VERFSTSARDVFAADHDGLVFNARSGETHYLPPASWLVFEALYDSPRTFAEIVAILRAAFDPSDAEDVEGIARRFLEDFRNLWLLTTDDAPEV
jgi:PqqD family protein of HPr-rel-A system